MRLHALLQPPQDICTLKVVDDMVIRRLGVFDGKYALSSREDEGIGVDFDS